MVVGDGSTDATDAEVLARTAAEPGGLLVRNPGPHGVGWAIRRATPSPATPW